MKAILRFLHRCIPNPVVFYRTGTKVLVRVLYSIKFEGFDQHIPHTGPAVLISNHVSYMDGLVIDAAVEREVRYIIDEHVYNVPFVHYFMSQYKAIPILPNRESVTKALEEVSEALKRGDLVCIFPEGQLTYTGNMARFRFGIEWILRENPVPVVPIAIKGLWGSILSRKYRRSRFRYFPRSIWRKVHVKCGPCVIPEEAEVSHLQRVIMELKNSI